MGAVQGFVVEAGGGPEVHRRSGGGMRNVRSGEESSGEQDNEGDWDRSHAQAGLYTYVMATLVQELRNEEQFLADCAHGVARVA